jgi:hypothetical protein
VDHHDSSSLAKLGAANRTQAVEEARRLDLVGAQRTADDRAPRGTRTRHHPLGDAATPTVAARFSP